MRLHGPLPDKFLRLMSEADRALFAPGQSTQEESMRKAVAKNERQLQGWLVGVLRLRGIEPLWFRTDRRTAATIGWPDITFAFRGQAVAWEAKMPGEKPRAEQIAQHCLMIRDGWIVEVIHSVDEGLASLSQLGASVAILSAQ
jgi:hypothetical protein